METTLNRDLTGVDVPPFSYTGIAHTFRNSPFNEYPYAMARLRWFTDTFDPGQAAAVAGVDLQPDSDFHDLVTRLENDYPPDDHLTILRSALLFKANLNRHFAYLHVSDAGLVDAILDAVFRKVTNGEERNTRDLGPHEPGIGRWLNEDEFNERHWLALPAGSDRQELFDRVAERLRIRNTGDATFDEIYLYPPDYGNEPGGEVRHAFRIFGHTDSDDSAAAGARLRKAVEAVLGEIRQSVT